MLDDAIEEVWGSKKKERELSLEKRWKELDEIVSTLVSYYFKEKEEKEKILNRVVKLENKISELQKILEKNTESKKSFFRKG